MGIAMVRLCEETGLDLNEVMAARPYWVVEAWGEVEEESIINE